VQVKRSSRSQSEVVYPYFGAFNVMTYVGDCGVASYFRGCRLQWGLRLPNVIQHVFVLMLENRSLDHMLGFSGITGNDAVTGGATAVSGLLLQGGSLRQLARDWQANSAGEIAINQGRNWPPPPSISVRSLFNSFSNSYGGQVYPVTQPADYVMPVDPGHEFPDVVQQLCGEGMTYPHGGAYPPITNSGFVASYVQSGGGANPGEIMKCYSPGQLPVLNQLAQEFVVCDNWHCSMPGPTWPNRFFALGASSGGLDHSPSALDITGWELPGNGFKFPNGSILDLLNNAGISWQIYAGDNFPVVGALSGVDIFDINDYSDFAGDVAQANYQPPYTFIEPNYGDSAFGTFKCGTSQHPMDDVTRGEVLIKATYEAIRSSPIWGNSLLIITWDEHGGFYDHVMPPRAIAPGDTMPGSQYNQWGFTFQQYGPRVSAVVISPLIPKNLIDHRLYDHSSIPATLESLFGLGSLTQRDANANNLMSLISLNTPRADTPAVLVPTLPQASGCDPVSFDRKANARAGARKAVLVARPSETYDAGNTPGFLFVALRADLAVSPPVQRPAIRARFNNIRTRADAARYMEEVRVKVSAARNKRRREK
jgi:phospholipase C